MSNSDVVATERQLIDMISEGCPNMQDW